MVNERWLIGGLIFLYSAVYLVYGRAFEDAYITFRYARNIADGLGPTFNPGEPWVEGFSSPLWTLWLALFSVLSIDRIDWVARITSWLCGAVGFGLLVRVAFRWADMAGLPESSRIFSAFLPGIVLATGGGVAYWAGTGMETALALCLALAMLLVLPGEDDRGRPVLLGVLAGLLVWTRPEGLVFAFTALLLSTSARSTRGWWPFVALVALLFGLRFAVFGEWLPNTFYAKVPLSMSDKLATGSAQIVEWAAKSGVVWLPFAAWMGLRRHEWMMLAFALMCVYLQVYVGADAFAFSRFLLPATVVVLLVQGQALGRMMLKHPILARSVGWLTILNAAFGPISPFPPSPAHPNQSVYGYLKDVVSLNQQYHQLGRVLERVEHNPLVAMNAVGIIPYVSGVRTLDLLGLTDHHIAHEGQWSKKALIGHGRFDVDYVLERSPELILYGFPRLRPQPVMPADVPDRRWLPGDRAMLEHPGFRGQYRVAHIELAPGFWLSAFVRRDVDAWKLFPHAIRVD